jgi:AcrR family transcriptional regulator
MLLTEHSLGNNGGVTGEGPSMSDTTMRQPAPVRPLARVGDVSLVERRRAQIVEAASRLISRQGFAKTVVREIAEEANISVGLVYEYVRHKEDILFLIYEHWSRVWVDGLERAARKGADPLERLESAVTFLVQVADRHADATHLFYREPGNLSDEGRRLAKNTETEMVRRLEAVIEEATSAGLLRPEIDAVMVATSLILLAHGWVLKGYLLRQGSSPRAYAASVIETAVQGWATPEGRRAWQGRVVAGARGR